MPAGRIPATGHIVDLQTQARAPINQTLYINKVGSDGWVQAKPANGPLVPLHKYTKVVVTQVVAGRTYFKVLEGHHQGQVLSMQDANAKEYLGTIAPVSKPATLVVKYGHYVEGWYSAARQGKLDQQFATLQAGALSLDVTMNSVWGGKYSPLPPGRYKVLLPDAPHQGNMTTFYRSVAPSLKYDQVWFPIQYKDNSRYVHVGNLSEGCVTVTSLEKWSDLQELLISHRGPDGISVATLEVTGNPEKSN